MKFSTRDLRRDLRLEVLMIYFVLLVPLAVLGWGFDWLLRERLRADAQVSDLALMQAIAQETQISITNELNAVRSLADYPAVRQGEQPEMGRLFELIARAHPGINLVYRLDAQGRMQYHHPVGPGSTVGQDFSFRDYFQRARQTNLPFVSQGRISPTTGQAVATAVMPLWDEQGQFLGVVGANIRLEHLSEMIAAVLSQYPAGEGMEVIILDSADRIVAASQKQILLQPATEQIPTAMLTQNSDVPLFSQVLPSLQGQQRLYTRVSIPALGWRVFGSRSTAIAFATQTFVRGTVFLVAVIFGIIALLFWLLLSQWILRPIEQLAEVSRQITERQQLTPESRQILLQYTHRLDQIGSLMNRILEMNAALERRIKEQNTLLETSAAVVSTLDLDGVLQTILEQMGRLLAIQMYAIIQQEPNGGTFRIRASRGLSPRYVENLSILPTEPDSVTLRALKIGHPVQVSDTETDPSYTIRRMRARAEGYRAVLAVPLRTHHAPPTALVVFYPVPHVFDEGEIRLLVSFANHAAMSIENATLFERSDARLQEQTYRLQSLIESLQEGLILGDLDGKVTYINRQMTILLGGTVATLREAVQCLLARAEKHSDKADDMFVKDSRSSSLLSSYDLSWREHGQWRTYRLQTFDVIDAEQKQIGSGILLHDITADKELDRMRANLIATVSHELRTPLAAIKGYATTLLADDVEWQPQAQRNFLQVISDETDRLSNMVNEILDLSRLESGVLRLQLRLCAVNDLIKGVLPHFHNAADRIHLSLPEHLPAIMVDPLRIQTVLRNLIENALKYGGQQVQVWVQVEQESDSLLFRVCDDGPGIPPSERERIFEPFYRISETAVHVPGGAGLGLAICQGLIQAHGGKLWLETQPKPGACFAFRLPTQLRTEAFTL